MKLKINLSIILLLSSLFLAAQQNKRDSLKQVIKTHSEDTNKVNELRLLAVEYMNSNPDTAIIIANQCLSLATKLSSSQNESIANVGKKVAARVTGNIGGCYERKSEFDKALEYDNKAVKMAEKIGNKLLQANNLGNIGIIYFKQGNYSKALEFDQRALKIAKEIDNKKLQADNLGAIGTIYYIQSNYPNALSYYFEALKIDEEMGNKKGVEMRLGNIGNVYVDQKDFPKALDYYKQALKISEDIGDEHMQASKLGNIGVVYYELSNYEIALEYFFKSLKIAREIGDIPAQSNDLSNIANVYKLKLNHQKALEFYLEALKLDEQIQDKHGVAAHLGKIGIAYADLGKFKKAEEYLNKALTLSTELNTINLMKENERLLADFYEEINRKDLAYIHFKKYIALRDSIFNEENTKLLMHTEMDHEFEKKQAVANAEHKSEMAKQAAVSEEKQRRQNVIIWSVGVGLLLVFVFAIFVLRSLRITNKQKLLIEIKNKETHEQKLLIEEKAFELAARHKEITDSINYAERIQRSFLATKQLLDENLNEKSGIETEGISDKYFVLFKPKVVVSGDFYWASKLHNGNFALVTADSTGHGVPGAIMSILNISSLEKAVEQGLVNSAEIFNHTRETIIERLKKDGSIEGGKDGMDASITVYDFVNKKLFVTAAHNPVWIVRNNPAPFSPGEGQGDEATSTNLTQIIEVKPDKMPVGKHDRQDVSFTTKEIDLKMGDVVYTLTDGFPDQFGGENGKKFMSKKLRELIASNSHLPMDEQQKILEQTFTNWIGNNEQVDDVTIIGVRV